ncbi:MAG: alpha-L-arabinofuranosidase C-terminal domain-containing protein [Bacteroidales bacterium]
MKPVYLLLILLTLTITNAKTQVVVNPSFEKSENNTPAGWIFETWDKNTTSEWAQTPHSGDKSVAIICANKGWGRWSSKTPLIPYSNYRFTGWLKTENLTGNGAFFSIGNIEIPKVKASFGTQNWEKVEFEFNTKGDDSGLIECILDGTGKVWFDDIKLTLIDSKKLSPQISIDVEKQNQPISDYIYGQFIEHLGKCIYGGIWAEIVNDRKFFYKPGEKESVWEINGNTDCLTMSETPYVGQNTPEVKTSKNQYIELIQQNIPLIKDMNYTGQIVAAGVLNKGKLSVSIEWGDKAEEQQTIEIGNLQTDYQKIPLQFQSRNTTEQGILRIRIEGDADVKIGTISLMPANNINGFRADVISLLKELNSPIYRWPGGNFVSGYNWKDGIGDIDRRPPRKNPAWKGIEPNDVGIDEFMQFCRILNTEPFIAVNSGLGDVSMASEEVEYCNGAVGTTMGHLRADNGNSETYNVKYWSVGNEMFGDWQLGHMPIEEYVKRHNVFAQAMKTTDSSIVLIGVGNAGEWDEAMLKNCSNNMDLISEHIYRQDWHGGGLMTHVKQLADDIREIGQTHREYRNSIDGLKNKNIRIAMDEWNYWYGPHIYGELGTRYFWRDGMGIAAGLHEFFRNSDIYFMANYAQTVNVIGCIKTTGIASAFETTGLVLKMYRQHFGKVPVEISGSPEPLDVVAALTNDGRKITVAVINPTDKKTKLPIKINGVELAQTAQENYIYSQNDMNFNTPEKPDNVKISTEVVTINKNELTIRPKSVSIFTINITKLK